MNGHKSFHCFESCVSYVSYQSKMMKRAHFFRITSITMSPSEERVKLALSGEWRSSTLFTLTSCNKSLSYKWRRVMLFLCIYVNLCISLTLV